MISNHLNLLTFSSRLIGAFIVNVSEKYILAWLITNLDKLAIIY